MRYPDIDPVLMTMVHDIDLTLWITGGELQSVLALRRPRDTFRSETLITRMGQRPGRCGYISSAWTVPTVEIPPDRVEIVCEQGSVEMELRIAIRVFGKTPREIDLRAEPPDDMLATELAAFLDGVRRGIHPGVVTLNDARNGLRATDAILPARSRPAGVVAL